MGNSSYLLPRAELPAFIRGPFPSISADKVQVRMTGATLEIKGAPIHTISWESSGAGNAKVVLEASTHLEFDGSYFDKCMNILESAFRALILMEPRDEQNSR